jgi:radical SAM superfamily enzyme YgiQ (UPF0313 family)
MPFGWTPVAPPVLEYLGALTKQAMPDVELHLIDGSAGPINPDQFDLDLVGISCLTATAVPGYRIADGFRRKGTRVIIGGMHASALPAEAKKHADAVVVGEAESVWNEVLKDAKNGSLKPFYQGEQVPLDNLPTPLYGHLKGRYRFRGVFTSRGCPFNCSFCSVKPFFGSRIRYRPIEDVVRDVDLIPGSIYMNSDENVWGGNIERAVELFTALRGSKKKWLGFGSLGAAHAPSGDRLLKAARECGLITLWVGWEALSEEAVRVYGAQGKLGNNREDAIRKIKDHGIDVSLFVMLGGRADTMDDFERTIETADRLGVSVHPSLVVPYPGTKLYEEYAPFIMKDMGWECYTGAYALFDHPMPDMTPAARERKFYEVSLELLKLKRLFKHLTEIPFSVFPASHMISLMSQLPVRQGMKKAYEEWKSRNPATWHPPAPADGGKRLLARGSNGATQRECAVPGGRVVRRSLRLLPEGAPLADHANRDRVRTTGTILVGLGVSMWIVYALGRYLLGWDVTDRQFLPYHLATILPGMVLRYHCFFFHDIPHWFSGAKEKTNSPGRGRLRENQGVFLKALIVVNNFVHDLFTGLWTSSLVVIVLLDRRADSPEGVLVASSLHEVMRIFFWLGVASIAVILASGSLRMLYYGPGISAEEEKIKKELLIVKHVFFTFAFIGGTYLAYVYAFS